VNPKLVASSLSACAALFFILVTVVHRRSVAEASAAVQGHGPRHTFRSDFASSFPFLEYPGAGFNPRSSDGDGTG
jgi:hypothetical protein